MPKFGELLFGKKEKVKQKSTKTKEQLELQSLIDEGLKKGTGPFADVLGEFDQEGFDKGVTEPALKQFKDKTLPMIQEKFSSGNAIQGSGARRTQANAAVDLQSRLAELMYNAQNKQKDNRLNTLNNQVNAQNVENIYKPSQKGFVHAVAENAGAITSTLAGGV